MNVKDNSGDAYKNKNFVSLITTTLMLMKFQKRLIKIILIKFLQYITGIKINSK